MNLLELTIKQYHAALVSGLVTTEQLVLFYLERIARFDSKIASIISINPTAIASARKLDQQYASSKTLSGPLHGVPVLLKDNIETEDMATTAGSLSLASFFSEKDADLVIRLKAAGAIILAKTNLHEFAIWGESISSIKGQTYNPYDLTRTPGGSSGGTGAALAANFGLVGIGTDTINSIRSPASANNLVGIRPTKGLVKDSGVVPYSLTQDTAGPMARTVADASIVLEVISSPVQAVTPPTHIEKSAKRVGVLRSLFGSPPINAEVNQAMTKALSQLEEIGLQLVVIDDQFDLQFLVNQISVHLYELVHDLDEYLEASQAPVRSVSGILSSGKYHPGIHENLLTAVELSHESEEYQLRLGRRKSLQQQLTALFNAKSLDALVFPHQQQLVCKVGSSQLQRNGALAAITGFPSVCMPAGFSPPTSDAPLGVPIGLELLGLPFDEQNLFSICAQYEAQFPKRQPPLEDLWL